jgi:hypothetical protein
MNKQITVFSNAVTEKQNYYPKKKNSSSEDGNYIAEENN